MARGVGRAARSSSLHRIIAPVSDHMCAADADLGLQLSHWNLRMPPHGVDADQFDRIKKLLARKVPGMFGFPLVCYSLWDEPLPSGLWLGFRCRDAVQTYIQVRLLGGEWVGIWFRMRTIRLE